MNDEERMGQYVGIAGTFCAIIGAIIGYISTFVGQSGLNFDMLIAGILFAIIGYIGLYISDNNYKVSIIIIMMSIIGLLISTWVYGILGVLLFAIMAVIIYIKK